MPNLRHLSLGWYLVHLGSVSLLVTAGAAPNHAAPSPPRLAPVRPAHSAPLPYTHGAGYTWVAGRLEHSTLEGGFWRVIYARSGQAAADPYGGTFVLDVPAAQLARCRHGALVLVRGQIDTEAMGVQMAGTVYRVHSMEPLRQR